MQKNILLNKKKIKFFFSFFVLMICCASSKPKYCQLSDRIFITYNKELKKQRGLYLEGKGGAMMHDVEKVIASYISLDRMSIKEARKLYIDVIEGYICRYNQNKQIRPYLRDYPFTVDNVEVMIGFENEEYKHMDQGFVALMFIGKNQNLVYCTYDHEKQKFIDLHEEPYETACAIVLKGG